MTMFTPETLDAATCLLAPEVLLLPEGPVRGFAVIVTGGRFGEISPVAQLAQRNPQLRVVRMDGKLLMPGFHDAHHHLTQSFGKALAFGEPSEIFRRVWVPMEQNLDDDAAYVATKLASLEALRGGFTTVVDAGTRAGIDLASVAQATRDAGVRCVLGTICNNVVGSEEVRTVDAVVAEAQAHLARWDGDTLVHPSLAVSIPEAASDDVLRTVSALSAEAGAVFQTHVNEHLAAVERSLELRGRRPLEHLHSIGALGPQVLAAHATMLTTRELCMLRDTDTAISYNPVASAWKGNAVAPATAMAELGVRFGLGTDGTRGDAFRLVDAAETAQRLVFGLPVGDSSCGGGWTRLDHGLSGGASAVGLAGRVGEISTGAAADFLVVDLEVPEMQPSWDLTWELVRLAGRSQITCVVVDGRVRLWEGWPVDWDGRALVTQAAKMAQDVVERSPIRRIHPVSSEHRRASTSGLSDHS
jgi:cytosine/adenosine deaminase-related metal-dependent hydrolase